MASSSPGSSVCIPQSRSALRRQLDSAIRMPLHKCIASSLRDWPALGSLARGNYSACDRVSAAHYSCRQRGVVCVVEYGYHGDLLRDGDRMAYLHCLALLANEPATPRRHSQHCSYVPRLSSIFLLACSQRIRGPDLFVNVDQDAARFVSRQLSDCWRTWTFKR